MMFNVLKLCNWIMSRNNPHDHIINTKISVKILAAVFILNYIIKIIDLYILYNTNSFFKNNGLYFYLFYIFKNIK